VNEYDPFLRLVVKLAHLDVRYVVIGVWAANYYAQHGGQVFTTDDRDLFVPPNPANLLNAWKASRESGYELWAGDEPLGEPLDPWLAERVVSTRSNTRAIHPDGVVVDFTLEMKGFDFETVWNTRRVFRVADLDIPVAKLSHIVESKAKVNRLKDQLFLATWDEALRDLMKDDE
jgi:hypothetical protein